MKEDEKNVFFDIFIKNTVYPEADAIFSFTLKGIEDIKDTCHVVIDTNALLVPYNIGQESLDQIKKTYRGLLDAKRLVIPGQVAREFAANRAEKLKELYQQLNRKRNSLKDLHTGKYPLLSSIVDYETAVGLEKQIDRLAKEYREAIGKVLDHVVNWNWNDPVSSMYKEMFDKDVIHDLLTGDEKMISTIKADLNNRVAHSIPPGYKDANKDDGGIGDLLIWYCILGVGKEGKDVIFVSNEGRKGDWRYRSDNQTLYPRYELIDEFRRVSGGRSFHMLEFSGFLRLFDVKESVIEEVVSEEKRIRSTQGQRPQRRAFIAKLPEGMVLRNMTWPEVEGAFKLMGAQVSESGNSVTVTLNGVTSSFNRPRKSRNLKKQIRPGLADSVDKFLKQAKKRT